MKENDICPDCNKGVIEIVEEDFPYSVKHFQCSICCSTYNIDDWMEKKETL